LLKEVQKGVAEQVVREKFTTDDGQGGARPMNAVEFAQQMKQAMVEAGIIKQAGRGARASHSVYEVTTTGRLNLPDFADVTGASPGEVFSLESPRGRSKAWRLVPVKS
jgi:hypothetical protein